MKMLDFIIQDAVIPELVATTRDDTIFEMMDSLVASGAVDAGIKDELISSILEREKHGSTGFGKGVAVPHVKHDSVEKIVATVAVSQTGVDFNALDKSPVYSFVMVVSPKGKPEDHLQAMENIFSNLQKDNFRKFLKQADTREAIIDLLEEADANKIPG